MNIKIWMVLIFLSSIFEMVAQQTILNKADEEFEKFAFIDARKIYLDVAKKGYSSLNLYKNLGDSYYFNGELSTAVFWYKKLTEKYSKKITPEYLYRYSQSLKSVKRYDEADAVMLKFNQVTDKDQRGSNFLKTRNYLEIIDSKSGKYVVSELKINSELSDYAPSMYFGDLVFASSRVGSGNGAIHKWNKMPFSDLYISKLKNKKNKTTGPKKLKGTINSKYHESSSCFSKDGQIIYFTRNNYTNNRLGKNSSNTISLKLYRAFLKNDRWVEEEELPFCSNDYSTAHPSLSPDGTKLYFASDMPGTYGLSDVFVVDIREDGTFGVPINLGETINTEGRETFPFISKKGNLYFASDGHVGLGGLDIFISEKDELGFFSPTNIGKPINSNKDDFSILIDDNFGTGYFASNREGGKGSDDIYEFKKEGNPDFECLQYVHGRVVNEYTHEPIVNADVVLLDNNNEELMRSKSGMNGEYEFNLICDARYSLRIIREAFFTSEIPLKTTLLNQLEYTKNIKLKKGGLYTKTIRIGDDLSDVLQLEPIYFDSNAFKIRQDAEVELQKIIAALKQYPKLKLEIRSHTDSKAEATYNLKLSEQRARSTMKYFIDKGNINSNRLKCKGLGETQLLVDCETKNKECTEKENQLNRRSEFIVSY